MRECKKLTGPECVQLVGRIPTVFTAAGILPPPQQVTSPPAAQTYTSSARACDKKTFVDQVGPSGDLWQAEFDS